MRLHGLLFVCFLGFSACEQERSSGHDDVDARAMTDTGAIHTDAGTSLDGATDMDASGGSSDAAVAACTVSTSDFGALGAIEGAAQLEVDPKNASIYSVTVSAPLQAAFPTDVLSVEFYTGYAPFGTQEAPTPIVPGTYALTGDLLSYETCGVCVRVTTNVVEDESSVGDDYMVTGGTVTVSAVGDAPGETLTFAVSDLQFRHVVIDPESYETTPVDDSCTTAISDAAFTGIVSVPTK